MSFDPDCLVKKRSTKARRRRLTGKTSESEQAIRVSEAAARYCVRGDYRRAAEALAPLRSGELGARFIMEAIHLTRTVIQFEERGRNVEIPEITTSRLFTPSGIVAAFNNALKASSQPS